MPPRPPIRLRLILFTVLAVAGSVSSAAALYLNRTHVIVYRAVAPDCDATVQYGTSDERPSATFHGPWEQGPVDVTHGEVASMSVLAGPDCAAPVRCEIIEDGVSVVSGSGPIGALCSAATAR